MTNSTVKIAKSHSDTHTIKCGTATLGRQAQIELHIGSPASKPIRANLTHRVIIGRGDENHANVDINISAYEAAEKGVSRCHAALEVVDKTLMVSDLNSTNGTFINGQPILPGHRRVVRDGDELLLGHLLIQVYYLRSDFKGQGG